MLDNGTYYLYGTTRFPDGNEIAESYGFDVYVSRDLESFEGPYPVFSPEEDFFGLCDFWAPEVHAYRGAYYMLATFKGASGLHGVGILKSDSPRGPFTPHSRMPITPTDWAALDGTLYIDKAGKPYMVFCHEWSQITDGTMCYAPLSEDLTHFTSEPITMFPASENPFGRPSKLREGIGYITDGPCMYRTSTDRLLMLWSMRGERGYMECVYRSDNGELSGSFSPISVIYPDDGGHGMIFRGKDSLPRLVLHTPNTRGDERAKIFKLTDTGDNLIIS